MSDIVTNCSYIYSGIFNIKNYDSEPHTIFIDTNNNNGFVSIYYDCILNIGNGNGDIILDGLNDTTDTRFIRIAEMSTLNIYDDVTIQNCKTTSNGIIRTYDYSTINMYGGKISNNYCNRGTIYARDESIFNMYGGEISNNTVEDIAGGIYISESEFNMTGGTIKNNSCNNVYGNGIYAEDAEITLSNDANIDKNNDIFLSFSGKINLQNYTNTDSSAISLENYYAGRPVLIGDVNAEQVAKFTLLDSTNLWYIDNNGILQMNPDSIPDFYVNILGNDTNDGKTPETPFQTLQAAIDAANANGSGTIYAMSDLKIMSDTLEVTYPTNLTINAYGDTAIIISRDTTKCFGGMIDNSGSLTLGEENRTDLIFDGGYDTTNYFIANESIINNYYGILTINNNVTLQNNNTQGNCWGPAVYNDEGLLNINGGNFYGNIGDGTVYNTNPVAVEIHGGNFSNNKGEWVGVLYNDIDDETTINIYDINIENNSFTDKCAGICNYSENAELEFNFYDGKINNNSSSGGTGIYNYAYDGDITFNMHDGEIQYNTADLGAGVYNYSEEYGSITMNMYGGSISKDTAYRYSAILNEANEYAKINFNIFGGNIDENYAIEDIAGIGSYANDNTCSITINMNGGSINDNIADYGSGVGIYEYSTFNLNNGTISGNKSIGNSSGINLYEGTLNMNGGTIANNVSDSSYASAIFSYESSINFRGGSIENNTDLLNKAICLYSSAVSFNGDIDIKGNIANIFNSSYITIDGDLNVTQPITISVDTTNTDTIAAFYEACMPVIFAGDDYEFKQSDKNAFVLPQNNENYFLDFSSDNSFIGMYQTPDSAAEAQEIEICGSTTINGITYTESENIYLHIPTMSCDSLVAYNLIVYPLASEKISEISGETMISTEGTYSYSVENIEGFTYQWSIDPNAWTITGSGANIDIDINSASISKLSVEVIGECDTTTRFIYINAVETNIDSYAENGIAIFPNPASENVQIQVNGTNNIISIIDMFGKEVKNIKSDSQTNIVNVSNLAKGVYFVKVDNGETVNVSKFVKQ